jgi:uncharacterized protein YfdQ (DUF2303 family)
MTTEAEKIVELANAAAPFAHVVKTDEGREFLVVPGGFKHQDVTEAHAIGRHLPEFITQHVTLQTADSLVDYCNRYKSDDTVLFADIAANSIVAQVDYHAPPDRASYVAHRASLKLEFSTEWAEWTKISGVLMDQLAFARFIEENGADVRAPDAAELLECVRDLQAHRKVNFTKAVRTSSDNENFEYSEETEAKRRGGIEIPTKFKLGVPVYFGEPEAELFAFLRWRLGDGSLTLGIQLHRAEHVRQAIFKQIVLDVAAKTECPAVFGKI